MWRWAFLSILVFFFSIVSCNGRFVLVTPNLIRADTEENVFLQASGVSESIRVTIKIKDFKTDTILNLHYATLNHENGHHTLATVEVPSQNLKRDEKQRQYIYMEVSFGNLHTEKRAILVSFHVGYIFIQTDKPIYKPEDTVMIRLYASSPSFKASNLNAVSVDIKNPDGVVIYQKDKRKPKNPGLLIDSYTLPKTVSEGTWMITAKFDHWPQNTYNTTFLVKKYVLPAFRVTLTSQKPYLDVSDTHLIVKINARYLYDQDVIGSAYIVYGLKKGTKIMRAPKVKEVDIKQDGGTLRLNVTEITQACEVQSRQEKMDCSIASLVDSYVYIKVSVLSESGGDLAEVEKSDIKIVNSPYMLEFKNMQKYFKPGLPFHFTIHVTYHDGTPAHNIPLTASLYENPLQSHAGIAEVSINMPNVASTQTITVKTKHEGLTPDRQASKEVTVNPYISANFHRPNYLYIHARNPKVEMRELTLEMSIKSEQKNSISHISYMILSKGKILEAKRTPVSNQHITSVTTTVTRDMMPTFRFVAFYILGGEVVSDSIKLEVTETCVNHPEISAQSSAPINYRPGSTLRLKIRGEPLSNISLVIVDQAVYLLSKNRFTQRHILDEVDSRDIGCTHGSGKDAMGVFSDAGLLFGMQNGPSTESRQALTCSVDARRRRRTLLMEQQTQLLRQFQEKLPQRCCRDGLRSVLMPYTCEQRSQFITEGPECITAFLKCCNVYKNKITSQRTDDNVLGRSRDSGLSSDVSDPEDNNALWELGEDDEDEEYDIDDIKLRHELQDTWLWLDLSVPNEAGLDGLGTLFLEQPIKDSITQWSLLAVSSSDKTGFCVAEPWTFVVKQNFFVDLKLPFSVARNEQVEIKAVVYNYLDEPLNVNVVLAKTKDICSVAFKRQHTQKIKVRPHSSMAVPYTIVPFKPGKIPIQVAAYVVNYGNDRIMRTLNVVVEGVQKTKSEIFPLNPSDFQGNVQVVQTRKPVLTGVVPNSEPETKIIFSGNMLGETLDNAIQDDPLAKLIQMPGGCVEQNLAAITFPVIATLYLERTNGWETVGVQRKTDAYHYIKTGYSKQLNYKMGFGDESYYPPYRGHGPSTWITAYVVKVFTMIYSLIPEHGNIDNICESVNFLLRRKQLYDGSFTEANPVSNQYMTGGLRGTDSSATLTAFVAIALDEVRQANIDCSYKAPNMQSAMSRAAVYLQGQLQKTPPPRPYTKAIVSYALALIKDGTFDPTSSLLAASSGGTYWPDNDSLFSLEATGYALLALVKMGKLTEAKKPFDYLSSHRRIGGGSGNTQSTMVVLHALSEYLIAQPPPVKHSLNVALQIATRKENLNFNSETSYQSRSFNVPKDANLQVVARGNGMGTVEVVTFFNQLPEEDVKSCETFDMYVSMKISTERPPPGIINVFELMINVNTRGQEDVYSVILDISLPTGFTVETRDLENLLNSIERYIDHFYFDDKLTDRSSLIIHLYKVSARMPRILSFKLYQQFKVGILQPSSVTVYEYYKEQGQRCTQLYSPPQDQVQLTTICRNYICQCAQDDCCEIRPGDDDSDGKERYDFACNTLHHVFKVRVQNITSDYYDKYELEIINVIKLGVESAVLNSERRMFYSHTGCRNKCQLQMGSEYLIIGPESDQWTLDLATNKYMYVLGKDTWVERWPTQTECNDPAFAVKCKGIDKVTEKLSRDGCLAKK